MAEKAEKEEKKEEKKAEKAEKKLEAMKRDAIIAYGSDVTVEQEGGDDIHYLARDKNGTIIGVGTFNDWGVPEWTDVVQEEVN
ncbi:MAG: hypothetical protein LUD72_13545 [Bacteroidales bacterium]|nr:hypothetical protein [Bacteroidales bacterium]